MNITTSSHSSTIFINYYLLGTLKVSVFKYFFNVVYYYTSGYESRGRIVLWFRPQQETQPLTAEPVPSKSLTVKGEKPMLLEVLNEFSVHTYC